MDFEGGGLECCGDLGGVSWGLCWIIGEEGNGISTFERIASSMGVWEAIVKSGRLAKATRDLRSIKNACLSLVVLSPDLACPCNTIKSDVKMFVNKNGVCLCGALFLQLLIQTI